MKFNLYTIKVCHEQAVWFINVGWNLFILCIIELSSEATFLG